MPFYPTASFHFNTTFMLGSTRFWKPIVNGYSGFKPPSLYANVEQLQGFPDDRSMVRLAELGVTHVVVDARHMPEAARQPHCRIPAAAPDVHRRLAAVVLVVETGAMNHAATIAGALAAAAALWLSTATLGFTGAAGVRLAILPLSLPIGLLAVAGAAVVVALRRAGASLLPLALLGVPAPAVAAAVPAVGVPALGLAVVAAALDRRADVDGRLDSTQARRRSVRRFARPARSPGRSPQSIFALSAWRVAPMIPGGDEPHYLIITQSLLIDRALTIDDVHRRGDYRAYYGGELPAARADARQGRTDLFGARARAAGAGRAGVRNRRLSGRSSCS